MNSDPRIGAPGSGPWYRVVAIPDVSYGGTAERDYAAVLPALLDAARRGRPFVTGWLSRGHGAPLELLTSAGPPESARETAPAGEPPSAGDDRCELLFPWGARGVRYPDGAMADLDAMVWAPCPGRQAPAADPALHNPSWSPGGWGSAQPAIGSYGGGSSWLGASGGLTAAAPTLFENALTTL